MRIYDFYEYESSLPENLKELKTLNKKGREDLFLYAYRENLQGNLEIYGGYSHWYYIESWQNNNAFTIYTNNGERDNSKLEYFTRKDINDFYKYILKFVEKDMKRFNKNEQQEYKDNFFIVEGNKDNWFGDNIVELFYSYRNEWKSE